MAASPETVVVVPVPDIVAPSGVLDNIHVPSEGRLFNTTLPVALAQSGWVTEPTEGDRGVAGRTFMTTLPDGAEVQPDEFVTVKV